MQKLKFHFILLLFLVTACSKESENVAPEKPSNAIVAPAAISLPEALFTNISQVAERKSSTVIMNRLIEMVDATPEGASIHMSICGFNYTALVNALARAGKRGVALNLMIDMSSDASELENQGTIDALYREVSGDHEIVLVKNDAGSIAINHNKFVLFSEVTTEDGKAEHVVFQTSHNFTTAGTRKVQDAVTLSHAELYKSFLTYWNDMSELAESGMVNYSYKEFNDPDAGIYAYFLPKRRSGSFYGDDTIIEILNDITDPASATVRIGMSIWTDTRLDIVTKLDELIDKGAKVEVIVKPSVGDAVFDGLMALEKKGAFVKAYTYTNIHSKFMLIDGTWRGEQAKLIVTGSQNYTRNALRYNNEVALAINNSSLFAVYDDAFEQLKVVPE